MEHDGESGSDPEFFHCLTPSTTEASGTLWASDASQGESHAGDNTVATESNRNQSAPSSSFSLHSIASGDESSSIEDQIGLQSSLARPPASEQDAELDREGHSPGAEVCSGANPSIASVTRLHEKLMVLTACRGAKRLKGSVGLMN
jgi:hypothetical protein